MALLVLPDPEIPGVTRISRDPAFPRPRVGVFGGLHGNEPCGVVAIEALRRRAEAGELPLGDGTLVLVHGNPAATEAHRRHTAEGEDLNRLFDFRWLERLPVAQWGPEHHRALALRPVLESLDVALDLHSATSPTDPFAIAIGGEGSIELGRRLGLGAVTHRWEGPAAIGERVILSVLVRAGRPAVAVECGQHDAPETLRVAEEVASRFLQATGLLPGAPHPRGAVLLEVFDALEKPGPEFRFDRPLRGLERVPAGTRLGGEPELTVSEDAYLVLPNDGVAVGDQLVYLARPSTPGSP